MNQKPPKNDDAAMSGKRSSIPRRQVALEVDVFTDYGLASVVVSNSDSVFFFCS